MYIVPSFFPKLRTNFCYPFPFFLPTIPLFFVPLWLSWMIFIQRKFVIKRGCALEAKNLSAFFSSILYIYINWGKNMHTFTNQLGERYAFTRPFIIPFQSFFPPNMLFGHIFVPPPGAGGQTEKYTPLEKFLKWYWTHFPPSPRGGWKLGTLYNFFLIHRNIHFFRYSWKL